MKLWKLAALVSLAPRLAAAQVTPIYPALDEAEVSTHTMLLVQIAGAALDDPGLTELLAVRSSRGERIDLTPIIALEVEGGVELHAGPLELAPEESYTVLSRLAPCPRESPAALCVGADELELSRFRTGAGPDREPPSLEVVGDVETRLCEWSVALETEDEQAPAAALRVEARVVDDDATSAGSEPLAVATRIGPDRRWWGPTPLARPNGEAWRIELTPLDPSNNRGEPVLVLVPGCEPPGRDGSDVPAALGDDEGTFDVDDDGGCSVAPAAARRAPPWLALAALGGIALERLRRRRAP